MKRQYLGDSKDSFKWDYHDYLAVWLSVPRLTVAFMLTADDGSTEGSTRPDCFPARSEILDFCRGLQQSRELLDVGRLAGACGNSYSVELHQAEEIFSNATRACYFSGFEPHTPQLILLDPDNGFEPERSCSAKHVAYRDLACLLDQISEDSVVSVFQHFRRISFADDFARIRQRLDGIPSTAIYWDQLMFVTLTRSCQMLERVKVANQTYARTRPVQILE